MTFSLKNGYFLTISGENRGLPHLVALHRCFIVYTLKVCGNPVQYKSIGPIFPTIFSLSVSESHSGDPHNISDFFIVIFAMMISEQ